jgi:hypothetical protein
VFSATTNCYSESLSDTKCLPPILDARATVQTNPNSPNTLVSASHAMSSMFLPGERINFIVPWQTRFTSRESNGTYSHLKRLFFRQCTICYSSEPHPIFYPCVVIVGCIHTYHCTCYRKSYSKKHKLLSYNTPDSCGLSARSLGIVIVACR